MKESKIQQLFEAARKETVPEVPFNFEAGVISAIHRDVGRYPEPSIFEQLSQLFPRLATAAVIVIALCLAADFYFTKQEVTTTADVQQAAEELLFASN